MMEIYFEELRKLSTNNVYNQNIIESWLFKYDSFYHELYNRIKVFENKCNTQHIRNHKMFLMEGKFLDTYEVFMEVLECYKKESCYKEQIEIYNINGEEDKASLDKWLRNHKLVESKFISQFNQMFQNTTTPSGYEFIIRYPFFLPVDIKLDESDFKHTLQFLEILERSNRLQFIGDISAINDLELFEKKTTKTNEGVSYRREYKRRIINITSNDVQGTELKVKFMDGKTALLEDLKVGQRVKLYADIIEQNETENDGCIKNLLGWHITILN